MTPAKEPALPLGSPEEAGSFTVEEAAVVRTAFEALRSGVNPRTDDLARHCGLAPEAVAGIVDVFVRTGRAEFDDGGRLTGIVGLTTEATRHRIILEGVSLFTWCAFDAVGIPAALEVDAVVFTTCGYCQAPMEVELVAGAVPQPSPIRGWLPVKENCGNVKADFCPDANLFCKGEHLGAWREEAGMPEGLVMDLDALSNLGRRSWGPCA